MKKDKKVYKAGKCTVVRYVFTEIFIIVLISDVTFITKFKKLNNWRCTAQHAGLPRLFRN